MVAGSSSRKWLGLVQLGVSVKSSAVSAVSVVCSSLVSFWSGHTPTLFTLFLSRLLLPSPPFLSPPSSHSSSAHTSHQALLQPPRLYLTSPSNLSTPPNKFTSRVIFFLSLQPRLLPNLILYRVQGRHQVLFFSWSTLAALLSATHRCPPPPPLRNPSPYRALSSPSLYPAPLTRGLSETPWVTNTATHNKFHPPCCRVCRLLLVALLFFFSFLPLLLRRYLLLSRNYLAISARGSCTARCRCTGLPQKK